MAIGMCFDFVSFGKENVERTSEVGWGVLGRRRRRRKGERKVFVFFTENIVFVYFIF